MRKIAAALSILLAVLIAAPALAQTPTPADVQRTINQQNWTGYQTVPGLTMKGILLDIVALFGTSPTGPVPVSSLTPTAPDAGILTAEDQIIVFQSGVAKLTPVSALADLFGFLIADVHWNFASGQYSGKGCIALASCLSATNSGGYAQWLDKHWQLFPPNSIRVTDQGVLIEYLAITNPVYFNRDLTQTSKWTLTNITATHDALGIDNAPNAATTLTATADNATYCQTVTATGGGGGGATGEFTASEFAHRVSGVGEIDIALEPALGHSGTVWSPITEGSGGFTNAFGRYVITYDSVTPNPTFCGRIAKSGDSIVVDAVQIEPQVGPTSPIMNTNTLNTRAPDAVSFTGAANTIFNSGAASFILSTSGAAAFNFRHQTSAPFLGGGANDYTWQYAAMANFWNDGLGSQGSGNPPYSMCGNLEQPASNSSLALPAIFGVGWDNLGFVQACNGGTTAYSSGGVPAAQTYYLGSATSGPTAYITDFKLFASKLPIVFLQTATTASNPVVISDQIPASGWNNYNQSVAFPLTVGGTLPPFSGGSTQQDYGAESGLKQAGVTGPIQLGGLLNYIRIAMLANNCGVDDVCSIGTYGGSERAEFDGSTGNGGTAQFALATDMWASYSVCLEPGPLLTSNWFFNGQVHQGINPAGGGSPPFAMNTKIGEYSDVEAVTNGNQTNTVFYQWRRPRGVWEHIVLQLNFDTTGAQGKIHAWKNGTQIVNYNGVTGEVPGVGGPQFYYWKFGAYRGQSPEAQFVRFANETWSLSSLAAKITAPDAIATGYGTTCIPPASDAILETFHHNDNFDPFDALRKHAA